MFAADKLAGADAEPPPMELRALLMPAVPVIVEEAVAAIRTRGAAPGHAEHALERNLRRGLIDAVDRWFDGRPANAKAELHFALGRAQARAGRSLDELMSFYRISAQAMWRRLCELGTEGGIEPADLYRLAETGFGWVEEISTQAANGFAEEHSRRRGASHSRRSELVWLLLEEPQPSAAILEAAARGVGVELSATIAVFLGPSWVTTPSPATHRSRSCSARAARSSSGCCSTPTARTGAAVSRARPRTHAHTSPSVPPCRSPTFAGACDAPAS